MELSIFLARVFGLYFVIVCLAMLFKPKDFKEMIDGLLTNRPVLTLTTIITLIIGILLVVSHNIWVMNWHVIITLFAWLILLKGIIDLFFPILIVRFEKIIEDNRVYYSFAAVYLIIGLYFLFEGFKNLFQ